MIRVFEAVTKRSGNGYRLFIAGGVTNCPDWQAELIKKLMNSEIDVDVDIYNPRRKNFPIRDKNASHEQIMWEYDRLKNADMISFWFSRGSLNPISLYELGMWGNSRNSNIVVGVDEEYERIPDVLIQTKLARPDVTVMLSLDQLAANIVEKINNGKQRC